MNHPQILIIHNVRSAHNVGSMFRTADAAGVRKVFLTGYTPTPLDKFKRPQKEIAKTALGAEKTLPWEHAPTIGPVIKKLKKAGVQVVALEQNKNALDYRRYTPVGETALVVGNEVLGISPQTLRQCDAVVHIPMQGRKESLNVSVAAGVALFSLGH